MQDAPARYAIECAARQFSVAQHHIVAPIGFGIDAQPMEHRDQHAHILVEGESHPFVVGDIRQHQVVHIGIHTAPTALTAVGLYVMAATEIKVHLVVDQLVSAEYHGGLHLPDKEAVGSLQVSGHVFFHSQIEGQSPCLIVGQCDVQHVLAFLVSNHRQM